MLEHQKKQHNLKIHNILYTLAILNFIPKFQSG